MARGSDARRRHIATCTPTAMMPDATAIADQAMPPYSSSQKCATMPTTPTSTNVNAV